jgi:hypothetical protein
MITPPIQTALGPLHEAFYAQLSGDTALNSKVTGVYDYVDENTKFPYVTIGNPTVSPFPTKTSHGEEILVNLHVYSKYKGKTEAFDILNLMIRAATKEDLQLEGGFTVFLMELEGMNVITDIDGKTMHGIARFKVWVNN